MAKNKTVEAVEETSTSTTLQKHQKEVVDGPDRRIAWHSLGSGKTLTGLLKAKKMVDETGKPALFVVPAPLVDNIHKEIAKHGVEFPEGMIHVMSYQKAAKADLTSIDPSIVVVDEAHRLRNPGVASTAVINAIKRSPATLPMTGTLMYNGYHDIIPVVNAVAGKGRGLPGNPRDFDARYIKETKIDPGLWDKYVHHVTPGVTYDLKNKKELSRILNENIHKYEAGDEDFPSVATEMVNVDMTPKQHLLYKATMGELPPYLRHKVEAGLPPNRQELATMMAFFTGPRMISTSTNSFLGQKDVAESPKIKESVSRLVEAKKNDKNFKALVYSNFIESGITPAVKALEAEGMRVGTFTGSTSAAEKKRLREAMNNGELDVLAVSSSGSEGLDLKGVKHIHILDPHFNESKIKQVIGRGVRYKSHSHLPEEERHVQVTRFMATVPKTTSLLGLINHKQETSVDQYLHNLAQSKEDMQNRISSLVKTAEEIRQVSKESAAETALRYGKHTVVLSAVPAIGTSALVNVLANRLAGRPYGAAQLAGLALMGSVKPLLMMGALGATAGVMRNVLGPNIEKIEWV